MMILVDANVALSPRPMDGSQESLYMSYTAADAYIYHSDWVVSGSLAPAPGCAEVSPSCEPLEPGS